LAECVAATRAASAALIFDRHGADVEEGAAGVTKRLRVPRQGILPGSCKATVRRRTGRRLANPEPGAGSSPYQQGSFNQADGSCLPGRGFQSYGKTLRRLPRPGALEKRSDWNTHSSGRGYRHALARSWRGRGWGKWWPRRETLRVLEVKEHPFFERRNSIVLTNSGERVQADAWNGSASAGTETARRKSNCEGTQSGGTCSAIQGQRIPDPAGAGRGDCMTTYRY